MDLRCWGGPSLRPSSRRRPSGTHHTSCPRVQTGGVTVQTVESLTHDCVDSVEENTELHVRILEALVTAGGLMEKQAAPVRGVCVCV